jgi:hypothetical protein
MPAPLLMPKRFASRSFQTSGGGSIGPAVAIVSNMPAAMSRPAESPSSNGPIGKIVSRIAASIVSTGVPSR